MLLSQPSRAVHRLSTLIVTLSLCGCLATTSPNAEYRQLPNRGTHGSATEYQAEAQARSSLQQGRPEAAYRILEEVANKSPDPTTREHYQLLAVELLFQYGYPELAMEKMASLPPGNSASMLNRRQLLEARAALQQRDFQRALALLPKLEQIKEPALQLEMLQIQATVLEQQGQIAQALKTRLYIDPNLNTQQREQNHQAIWALLNSQSSAQLNGLGQQTNSADANGWIELSQLFRQRHRLGNGFEQQLSVWRSRYPSHPAARSFAFNIQQQQPITPIDTQQVAVLLPLQGKLGSAGQAIRDGLLAAAYGSEQRNQVSFYDVAAPGADVVALYQQAVTDGATVIVGPLSKDKGSQLVRHFSASGLPVPLLTLNYLANGDTLNNLFQIGLLPEDEARAVADYARSKGYQRAIALVPKDAYGNRMLNAFVDHFTALGGQVVSEQRYEPNANDFSNPIKAALRLNDANTRHKRVEQIIGSELAYTPERRQDVDFVYLPASTRAARLIKPQLKFYNASSLPVLSTAKVFEGRGNQRLDRDLDGIRFTDSPWVQQGKRLRQGTRVQINALPESPPSYARLQALGADAFTVLNYLPSLQSNPQQRLPGLLGELSLQQGSKVQRHPAWSVFRNGLPEPTE